MESVGGVELLRSADHKKARLTIWAALKWAKNLDEEVERGIGKTLECY